MPRMTFSQSERGQEETLQGTMGMNRLFGVHRASREEAALVAEPWAQQQAITANQEEEKGLHYCRAFIQCRCSESRSADRSALRALG